ncbi:J domain-containing protein [Phormidium sp. LEGE 05292]|uniref:J domain-containing protein n=1 Tax=[Phormidium] sp. LEGE 05292 TaxID=767427 RepID=UPI00188042C5|nr:J domain-containing protein [Phormidium sp. LEGE 05292]MBE9228645.1 J domain-containing protein [Phormidium sp. LEGE 05292]
MPRKKSQPKSKTPPAAASATLALSELHYQVDALEQENQRLIKQIKKKRTELNNFVDQMRSIATQMFHRTVPIMKKLTEIDRQIHSLFDEIFQRKFGKQSQRDIEGVYQILQMQGIISPKSSESQDIPELDELFGAAGKGKEKGNFSDFFAGGEQQEQQPSTPQATVKSEDSKKIRETFLKLAEIFHPDKVTDSETQMRHTEIMKELNKAYQEGDLAKLLEIEQQHLAGEDIANFTEDDLTRKFQILSQQNSLLKKQYENLKRELRLAKNTPEGSLISEYRQAVKMGVDPIEMLLEEMEEKVEIIEEVKEFVKDFRDKKITIKEFLKGPSYLETINQSLQDRMIEELFERGVIKF